MEAQGGRGTCPRPQGSVCRAGVKVPVDPTCSLPGPGTSPATTLHSWVSRPGGPLRDSVAFLEGELGSRRCSLVRMSGNNPVQAPGLSHAPAAPAPSTHPCG